MPVQHVSVDELTFTVHTNGPDDGPAVLLLHGFPQGPGCYDAVLPRLHGAGLRTIVPAQRGYSPGARPTGDDAYAVEHLVADALGLLDALGVGYAHVVGHDWGAAVAWQLAARHPGRVSSLVAASVGHPTALSDALATDADQRSRSAYMRDFAVPGAAEQVLAGGTDRLRALVGEGHDLAEAVTGPAGLDAALGWYRARGSAEFRATPDVEVPTTFLWGTEDEFLGRTQAVSTGRHVLAEYRFVELAGVGHWIPEDAAAALATEVVLRSSPW
jgi:pimeloyl-ACP methyl ester carboxylesterase